MFYHGANNAVDDSVRCWRRSAALSLRNVKAQNGCAYPRHPGTVATSARAPRLAVQLLTVWGNSSSSPRASSAS
jgi:hypothetical protein